MRARGGVFPTLVGVFLEAVIDDALLESLPHARGGVSSLQGILSKLGLVFPTLVGVFPLSNYCASPTPRSSPRSWGCFHHTEARRLLGPVFPTLVGVFPVQS